MDCGVLLYSTVRGTSTASNSTVLYCSRTRTPTAVVRSSTSGGIYCRIQLHTVLRAEHPQDLYCRCTRTTVLVDSYLGNDGMAGSTSDNDVERKNWSLALAARGFTPYHSDCRTHTFGLRMMQRTTVSQSVNEREFRLRILDAIHE